MTPPQENSPSSQREAMFFDVVIVGGGPAGLSAAIWLKKKNPELSVVVVEKAAEIGGHILSGAIFDSAPLAALIPDFKQDESCPLKTKVTSEEWCFLNQKTNFSIPSLFFPKALQNKGHYIVSLASLCRWLAQKAESLGVEIYPGFAATELLFTEDGEVKGIATGDMGREKDGAPGANFQLGMELLAKYTLIAEGARGSLAKQIIKHFQLSKNCAPQKYALGFKEIWQIDKTHHREGHTLHTLGWPLDDRSTGGGFLYHMNDQQIALGFIVHLDYRNPYFSPFRSFQAFKLHPKIRPLLEKGKVLAYGARTLTEGGLQSIPKLAFKGGALLGCSAGYMNVARLKGSHNAIYSGIAAAEEIAKALSASQKSQSSPTKILPIEQNPYQQKIYQDLYPARNVKPLLTKFGTKLGSLLAAFDLWCQYLGKFSFFGTLTHKNADFLSLDLAKYHKPPLYPKPDQKIAFDITAALFLANISHQETQPCHLKVQAPNLQKNSELKFFGGPSSHYCPAGVYEWVKEGDNMRYVINAQNCLHCKCCDIKDPNQNINWTPPQGGDGPSYPNM